MSDDRDNPSRTGGMPRSTPAQCGVGSGAGQPVRGAVRILLVGPMPPPLGGASVSFQHLVEDLRKRPNVRVTVVDTRRGTHGRRGLALSTLSMSWEIAINVRSNDIVMLNVSQTSLIPAGAFALLLCRLAGRPLVLRKFGGLDHLRRPPDGVPAGRVRRACTRWVLKHVDLYLTQTRRAVEVARRDGIRHVRWYPNVRPMGRVRQDSRPAGSGCARFVYLSQVRQLKGITDVVQAVEDCPASVSLDVYGPLLDGFDASWFEGMRRVRYAGVLEPEDVVGALGRYDAFVFPTRAASEGHPGVILEAYRAGLPVVASDIGGVRELVDSSTGLLVPPGDVDALRDAMNKLVLDKALCARLRAGVRRRREAFSSRMWADVLVTWCRSLHERGRLPDRAETDDIPAVKP